ncbi:heavy metal-binding domain-containing protein [Kribbella sp. NBC_00382]|uniref:YbjQ family protein n=1 Tax=Kribbella sp. NBC_00382 TaxID=2975967 RepID=UPI002E2377F7
MNQNFPPNPNQPYPPQQQGYQQGPPPGYQQGPPPQQYGYQPPPQQQNVPHVAPQGSPYPVLVSTMNDLPGYTAEMVFGEVFGLTVRSRDFGSNFTASFRSLGGGEVPEYTQMLAESRHVAVMRMCQMAHQMGANAILAMRFDCNEIAQTMSEVAAYGTAVIVRPVDKPRPQDAVDDDKDANDS